jgi:glycosyltransferase involved in cell wall biosynthesis
MVTAIQNGESGYVNTSLERLIERMHELIADPGEARRLGENARRFAMERFNIRRFVADWEQTFADVTMTRRRRMATVTA